MIGQTLAIDIKEDTKLQNIFILKNYIMCRM